MPSGSAEEKSFRIHKLVNGAIIVLALLIVLEGEALTEWSAMATIVVTLAATGVADAFVRALVVGHVFAADFYNHRIQKFAANGTFHTAFGAKGSGPGRFSYAIAVAVADDGTVFAVDFSNNRVHKWRQQTR